MATDKWGKECCVGAPVRFTHDERLMRGTVMGVDPDNPGNLKVRTPDNRDFDLTNDDVEVGWIPPCEHCRADLVQDVEEVDIGVGVQQHVKGWRCPNGCPSGFAACNRCGIALVDDKSKHHSWCSEVPR